MVQYIAIAVVLSSSCLCSAFFTTRRFAVGPIHSQLCWSVCAEIEKTVEEVNWSLSTTKSVKASNSSYSLTSPREWLEFNEMTYGNGAYSVVRCDYECHGGGFKIWGIDFHLDRLEASFNNVKSAAVCNTANARAKSKLIVQALLEDAEGALNATRSEIKEKTFVTLMVTILWQSLDSDINVRGHAFSALNPSTTNMVAFDPVKVSIAVDTDQALPDRFRHYPQSKLSSWCRRRRPLEQRFKNDAVGEVLLSRTDHHGKIQLLEGLTSNLFVVYPGNILRTPATRYVLGGYARHLVLKNAKSCGLEVEIAPILLEESYLWQEMFLTSSIRLISVVGEIITSGKGASIILPRMEREERGGDYTVGNESTNLYATETPKWEELLRQIVNSEGYEGG